MKMEKFVKLMTGHFDNREQFTEMKSAGKLFPYARHVNTVCNDKINNIPENFTGIFMVEESYYETDGKCHASPHLFLITDCDGGIMLSSYEIPAGEDKNTFSYRNYSLLCSQISLFMITFVQVLDFIGTFAFAISGIRLASAKQFDWFGA